MGRGRNDNTISDRENVSMELDHSVHTRETRLIHIHTHIRKGVAMDQCGYLRQGKWGNDVQSA